MRPSTTSVSASSSRSPLRAALAAALLLWGTGCVSFRVPVPDEAELTVSYLALLPAVDEKADFSGEIQSQPVAPGAGAVCALLKVRALERPCVLVWRWYGPDDVLARESPPLTLNARRASLESAVAWDRLPASLFANRPGSWQVVIMADGQLLARARFEVPVAARRGG